MDGVEGEVLVKEFKTTMEKIDTPAWVSLKSRRCRGTQTSTDGGTKVLQSFSALANPTPDDQLLVLNHRQLSLIDCLKAPAVTTIVTNRTLIHHMIREHSSVSSHLIDSTIEHCHKSLFRERDFNGDLPLHLACRVGVSTDTLLKLLKHTREEEAFPGELVGLVNVEGHTVIDLVWLRFIFRISPFSWKLVTSTPGESHENNKYQRVLKSAIEEVMADFDGPQNERKLFAHKCFGKALQHSQILVKASVHNDTKELLSSDYVLHAAAAVSCKLLPFPVLELLLWQHGDQVQRKDSSGRLPLHYAVMSIKNADSSEWQIRLDWISKLCALNRNACLETDTKGRLPLHYALDNMHATKSIADDTARMLLTHCPSAVEISDSQSGMQPALMAAANPQVSVETIFDMIRLSPGTLVSHFEA